MKSGWLELAIRILSLCFFVITNPEAVGIGCVNRLELGK